MGYQNIDAMKYVIDIETHPIAEAADYLDLSDISAPSNYKDEAKIKAYCEMEKEKRIGKAALDLDLCRVVAVGFMREDWNEPGVMMASDDKAEADMLYRFWAELDNRYTVGYNQVGFDLPVLLRRSLYLGVTAPMINLDKYRSPHIDLQQRLSLNGTKPYRALNWYCKRFKLTVPTDEHAGKDIGQLIAQGNWKAVEAHCEADVLKTKALAERMGVLRARVEQPECVL